MRAITRLVPRPLVNLLLPHLGFSRAARRRGLSLSIHRTHLDLTRANTVLRLSAAHAVYLRDAIESFDYYVTAVAPMRVGERDVVDYSTPRCVLPAVPSADYHRAARQHGVPLPLLQCSPRT